MERNKGWFMENRQLTTLNDSETDFRETGKGGNPGTGKEIAS